MVTTTRYAIRFRSALWLWVLMLILCNAGYSINECVPTSIPPMTSSPTATCGATRTLPPLATRTATPTASPKTTPTVTPTATAIPKLGDVVWRFSCPDKQELNELAYDAGLVVSGSSLGTKLYALEATTGQLRWSHDLSEPLDQSCRGPLNLSATTVFACTPGSLSALRRADGLPLWSVKLAPMAWHCHPTLLGERLVLISNNDLLWALDVTTGERVGAFSAGGPIVDVAVSEGAIYISTPNMIGKLNSGTREWLWRASVDRVQSDFALSEDTVYVSVEEVGSGNEPVVAFDALRGHKLGEFLVQPSKPDDGWAATRPLFSHDMLYIWASWSTKKGRLDRHTLYAIQPDGLKEKWHYDIGGWIEAFAIAENRAYFVTLFGPVHAVDLDSGREAWSFDLTKSQFLSEGASVVVAKDRLILAGLYQVIAVNIVE